MDSPEVATVESWHQLLSSGDVEHLMTLVSEDVEVGGPRGAGRGLQLFREWFGRAGVQLTPLRYFHRGNVVVAEENGTWRSPGGNTAGNQVVASLFQVEDGLITRIIRFDSLATALEEADLRESDHVL